jgi:hypothetical protein
MEPAPTTSDTEDLGLPSEGDLTAIRRLVAHLAPSEAPFRSRHGYFTPPGRPVAVLPRPDVLLLEVMRDELVTLRRFSADGEDCGLTISHRADELINEAVEEYGAENISPWEEIPEGETNASAFAVRAAEARRRGPLGPTCDRMSDEVWWRTDDVPAMIRSLRAGWHGPAEDFVRLIHRYLLASCRAIWPILPMEESRRGVEVVERYIEGRATREECRIAGWHAEGAALYLDPDQYQPDGESEEAIEVHRRWLEERRARVSSFVAELGSIPAEALLGMVRRGPEHGPLDARQVLADAAYFVDGVIGYHLIFARSHFIQANEAFLDPARLREMVGDPSSRQGLRS